MYTNWLLRICILMMSLLTFCNRVQKGEVNLLEEWKKGDPEKRGKIIEKVYDKIAEIKPGKGELEGVLGKPDKVSGDCYIYKYKYYYNSIYNEWAQTFDVCFNKDDSFLEAKISD